jgi:enoyl-CoA hydratase
MVARTDEILIRVEGRVGRITLNRPERINALSMEMINDVRSALNSWAGDRQVAQILIDGAGERGLCAGGDIRLLYDGIRGEAIAPPAFWADEYRMNSELAHFGKPIVAYMEGITLGGGVGISGHCSIRIVTETSQVGMPETAIGLAPDVGGLFLLSRAPGELGTHAALTGARLGAADAISAGLADRFLPADRLPALTEQLRTHALTSPADIAGLADFRDSTHRRRPCSSSEIGSTSATPATTSARSCVVCWSTPPRRPRKPASICRP